MNVLSSTVIVVCLSKFAGGVLSLRNDKHQLWCNLSWFIIYWMNKKLLQYLTIFASMCYITNIFSVNSYITYFKYGLFAVYKSKHLHNLFLWWFEVEARWWCLSSVSRHVAATSWTLNTAKYTGILDTGLFNSRVISEMITAFVFVPSSSFKKPWILHIHISVIFK